MLFFFSLLHALPPNISNKKPRPILWPALKTPVSLSFSLPGLCLFGLSGFACEQAVEGAHWMSPGPEDTLSLSSVPTSDICFWAWHSQVQASGFVDYTLSLCPSRSLPEGSSPTAAASAAPSPAPGLRSSRLVSAPDMPFKWECWSASALLEITLALYCPRQRVSLQPNSVLHAMGPKKCQRG